MASSSKNDAVVSLRLSAKTLASLKRLAANDHRKTSEYIRVVLDEVAARGGIAVGLRG